MTAPEVALRRILQILNPRPNVWRTPTDEEVEEIYALARSDGPVCLRCFQPVLSDQAASFVNNDCPQEGVAHFSCAQGKDPPKTDRQLLEVAENALKNIFTAIDMGWWEIDHDMDCPMDDTCSCNGGTSGTAGLASDALTQIERRLKGRA